MQDNARKTMELQKITKHQVIVSSYGIIILIYSLFTLLAEIIQEPRVVSIQHYFDWANYFFAITTISLFITPINFIIGYGLLRQRHWSRYAVMATMATLPICQIIQVIMWGKESFSWETFLVPLLIALLTFFYFSTKATKTLFGEMRAFRIKSWLGLLVIIIIFVSFVPILFSVVTRIYLIRKFNLQFFEHKPEIVLLQKQEKHELSGMYRKIRLLDTSMLIPKEFRIGKLRPADDKSNSWSCWLYSTGPDRGYLIYGNKFPFDELPHQLMKQAGLKSMFDCERFMLTNNWNPSAFLIRSLIRPDGEGFSVKEIHTNSYRGFLKQWRRKAFSYAEFSLYSSDNKRFAGGTFIYKKEYLGDGDILNIISSLEFLKTEDTNNAKFYYKKGLSLLQSGDVTQAEYEFANAYYLSPKDPDYIFGFAETLPKTGPNAYKHIKEMLDLILKIRPDYKEAQILLKKIEPKLRSETDTAK